MSISNESREKILASTDIVDLISSYIPVKRAGSSFKANCPFHNEKTPSFHINPQRQSFKCFGCGEGGDAISFVRKYEGLSFVDALKKLASRAGILIVEEAYDASAEKSRKQKGRLMELHREAAQFMHELLLNDPAAKHARNYLAGRGYKRDMAARWLVGWMPENPRVFLDWAREKKYTGRDLTESGIAALREENNPRSGLYLRFRDRLMFPIRNEQGEVIAFSGRQLREDPRSGKYVNSPETSLFLKSKVLFALDRARRAILTKKQVLICEGQLDVIACHEHGIDIAVATQGTALTPQHAMILKRHSEQAVLCFDADKAGYAACEKAFRELASAGMNCKVLSMPPGDDPDSFLKREGTEAFQNLLENARPFFDYKIDRAAAEGGLAHAQARADTAREIASLLAAISDSVSRDSLLNHCATRLQVPAPDLRSTTSTAKKRQDRQTKSGKVEAAETFHKIEIEPVISYLCFLSLYSLEAREYLRDQYETIHHAANYLSGTDILEKVLDCDASPENPAAINTFLATQLEEEERQALHNEETFFNSNPQKPLEQAMETLAQISARVLLKREQLVRDALAENPPQEKMLELINEAKEIAEMKKSLPRRMIADDRATLSTQKKFKSPDQFTAKKKK